MKPGHAAGLVALIVVVSQLSACFVAVPLVAVGAMARSRLKKAGSTPLQVAATPAATTASAGAFHLEVSVALNRFAPFVAFALDQHRLGQAGGARASVILAPDSTLERPTVVPCAELPTAVVVDADLIGSGLVLDHALRRLRAGGVAVLWTADSVVEERVLRNRLAADGIEFGIDRLLTPTSAAPRKQLVRQYAAIDHCIVAVAGTRRGDMDEIYDYLKRPQAASQVDVLWDAGWYLLPPS